MTPEEKKAYSREWQKNNKDKSKKYCKKYAQNNPDKIIAANNRYTQKRRQSDPIFKLRTNIPCLLRHAFKSNGYIKNSKSTEVLGCEWGEFKQHIESQFKPWMTWDNYGCKVPSGPDTTWDLDHIIPISTAVTIDDIKRLNHYTNFQPLCSFQNRFIKRDNVV